MASIGMTRQACKECRRRKVKCDGLSTCRNCQEGGIRCEYSRPQKRGPKVKGHVHRPGEDVSPPCAVLNTWGRPETPSPVRLAGGSYVHPSGSPESHLGSTANPLSISPDIQLRTAIDIHQDLIARLLVASPSESAATIANQCVSRYCEFVFGTLYVCHEATLRETISRFFVPPLEGDEAAETHARIAFCFPAESEPERIENLRHYTVLAALCAHVLYVLPQSLFAKKHLIAPLFLRAARSMFRIYEDYDLEQPNSSSLTIRLFLSSAVQAATGSQGVAFHILSEAGIIAMRRRLYDESSLEGMDPVEETLLRNAFWQLYVCDQTAIVMKTRPATIHESLFATPLTLKSRSRSFMPLFEAGRASSGGSGVEERLEEGFHVIRRLWAMAAELIQAMECHSSRTWPADPETHHCRENIRQLSAKYFDIINLTNWGQSPWDESLGVSQGEDHPLPHRLQRQWTSYLISLHSIKIFILMSAIQCNMVEVVGLSADPLVLAMRQIELAQDFLNVLRNLPFLHLQAEGEHFAEKIRRVGSHLLELAHTAQNDAVKVRANQCAMRLIDTLAHLNSRASDKLGQ